MFDINKENAFPVDEWVIIEENFNIENNLKNETIFSLGNGYIGMRGSFEEGEPLPGAGCDGTYINGFYESEIIKYGELAFGYAYKSQTMVNVANGKVIKLFVDDEEFNMLSGTITEYKRVLNLKKGTLKRELIWISPKGKQLKIKTKRLVSFTEKHIVAICYEVTPLNFDGTIRVVSAIDGDVSNINTKKDPRKGSGVSEKVFDTKYKNIDNNFGVLLQKTKNTGFELACAMANEVVSANACKNSNPVNADVMVGLEYVFDAKKNTPIVLNKYIAYLTSKDSTESELYKQAEAAVKNAREIGFAKLEKMQEDYLTEFWSLADVTIKGDLALQQGMRFNIFHILQSAGTDGKTNIAAKGLTGEWYDGHYFWDTEIYVLPFFLYHHPEISRKLLEYRYSILDKARERARELAHKKGALFSWRTIDGEECSPCYPAGTAQYHINADIVFAIKKYVEATEDTEFLIKFGSEILFETARLWADTGVFSKSKGNKFCINCVTGPDEYTAIVNNNCYTNLMAKTNLDYAYEVAQWMQLSYADEFNQLQEKIGLKQDEIEYWKKAADNMYIPVDETLGIFPQDDTFLDKEVWDFENVPKEKYPLLKHYHPLIIYRYQVCKQADLVLALFLLGDRFTMEEKQRNFDYYEKITTHDSSLSACIFSIMASEIGYHEKAYDYFLNTSRMDLDDYHGNTKDGVHTANMAGTWMCMVNGFAGFRVYDGIPNFSPYLPEKWEGYSFKIKFKGRIVNVTVEKEKTTYELLEGSEITIIHKGKQVLIQKIEVCEN